jgi:16S rRNA (uracil1498-N3)-methyltransferase
MITVLVEPGALQAGADVVLPDAEVRHLRARRVGDAVAIRLVDGEGTVGAGTLGFEGRSASVHLDRVKTEPPPVPLVLAVAAGDRDRFGWVVEKAAELGVTRVLPIETERSMNVATRLRTEQVEKLRVRGREAIKQSGSAWAPAVDMPVPLDRFLADPPPGALWLADPDGADPQDLNGREPVTVLVGPEGGFTPAERAAALDTGFLPVSLGPHTLRFETAAVAAAVMAQLARKEGRG